MASGIITNPKTATSGRYIESRIVWESLADPVTNASEVTAGLYVRKGDTTQPLSIPTEGSWAYSLTVNGDTVSGSARLSVLEEWVLVAVKTVKSIAHGGDGSKTITISGSVTGPSVSSFKGHKSSGSGTADLGVISRSSTITAAADAILGGNGNIRWVPASADFFFRLEFSIGDWKHTTDAIHPNKTTAYTYTGAIPLDAASQIPNDSTGTMTVALYTYSDSEATKQVGIADSRTFTVTVPNNGDTQPAVSMVLTPVSGLPAVFDGLYIQGKTRVRAALSAEGKYGATIDSYSMKVSGASYGPEEEYTSVYLSEPGNLTVYGDAADSREHIGTVTQTITVIGYSNPKILDVEAKRCNAAGDPDEQGTYLRIKAKRSYTHVVADGEEKNFCQIRFRFKAASAPQYSEWTTILERDSLESDEVITNALLGGALAIDHSYMVQVQAVDDVGSTADTTVTISTDKVWSHKTKNGLGLGKYCEGENLLDVGWDSRFYGEVNMYGDVKVGGKTLREYILSVIEGG